MSVTAIVGDIVKAVIEKVVGGDKLPADTLKALKELDPDKIASRVRETVVAVIAVEMRAMLAQVGIVLQAHQIAEATQSVLDTWNEAERKGGMVGNTLKGAQITILGPNDPMPADEEETKP